MSWFQIVQEKVHSKMLGTGRGGEAEKPEVIVLWNEAEGLLRKPWFDNGFVYSFRRSEGTPCAFSE